MNGIASTMMSDHQRHTEFLRHCIRYDESARRQELMEEIVRIQRDTRCVFRAVWLMALLAALVVFGLGYGAILVNNFPDDIPQFILNIFSVLTVSWLICILAFAGLGMIYRLKLNRRREECRPDGHETAGVPSGQDGRHASAIRRANRVGEPDACHVRELIKPARRSLAPPIKLKMEA